jgi:hypothetical protein
MLRLFMTGFIVWKRLQILSDKKLNLLLGIVKIVILDTPLCRNFFHLFVLKNKNKKMSKIRNYRFVMDKN